MNNKQIKMPSSDDTLVIRFGIGVVFIVFVLIGGWTFFAPLASSSVAVGKVSADSNKKTIQHLEGGIVDSIYVKDGDSVNKGQVLLKLRDVQIKAQLDILESQYQDVIALYSRLKAQRDNKDTIVFPEILIDENAIKDQKNIFYASRKSLKDERIITQNRIVQNKNQIEGLESLIKSKEIRLESLTEEILEWEELFKEGLTDKQRIRELKRENNMINGDIASTKSEISKLKEKINEIATQQLLREKELQNQTLQNFVDAKSQMSDLNSKIIAIKDTLKRTKIKAPIKGTIVGLNLHTVGGVISPGRDILEIVPNNSKLFVIAQVQISDIDKVNTGLLADIRFSAFNLQLSHVIEGKVVHVSADSFIDEITGLPYYEAKIEVTKIGLKQLDQYGFKLVSGMPAEVMIKIGDRTALSYFIKPFTDMLSRGFNEE